MNEQRKYVLTIAGFDPSAGAGILADIKTFENHKVYGLAVNTANTIQTESKFHSLVWEKLESVLKSITVLMDDYDIEVVKTGIVPSFQFLSEVIDLLRKKNPHIKIVVDPIISSSTGFDFNSDFNKSAMYSVLKKITLLTPNANEAIALSGQIDSKIAAAELSEYCSVLLKGGHVTEDVGKDILYSESKVTEFKPKTENISPKHGSGCILSAAIVSNLALGLSLEEACRQAKSYTEKKLSSNSSLLAYHV